MGSRALSCTSLAPALDLPFCFKFRVSIIIQPFSFMSPALDFELILVSSWFKPSTLTTHNVEALGTTNYHAYQMGTHRGEESPRPVSPLDIIAS